MEHESFRRPPLHGEKYCCPGKEACHPSPVIFREHFYEKKSDPFAKSQEYLCMPWLFCLDWVDLAAWARVFIWWKVGPAGMVTYSPGQKSLGQWEHNCNLSYVYHKNLMQCCQFTNPYPLPLPHPIQCWKIKGIVPWQFQHCLWGGGGSRDVQC